MVNQWGRDGTFSSAKSGSSGAAVAIATVVALIVGGGAGYTGARYLSGVSASDIAARDQKIQELTETLSELKFDSQGADAEQGALTKRVRDLEAQVQKLRSANEALKAGSDKQLSQSQKDAQAEIDALKAQLDEASKTADALRRAQKSLKVSELQIIDLEGKLRDQTAEVETLQKALQLQSGQAGSELTRLQQQNRDLSARLDDARKQVATISGLKAEIALLKDQLADRAQNADAEARKQIAALQQERADLKAKLDAALADAVLAAQRGEQLAAMKSRLDLAISKATAADAAAKQAGAERDAARADLAAAQDKISAIQDRNHNLADKADGLEKTIAGLKIQIAKLEAQIKSASNQSGETTQPDSGEQADTPATPRDRGEVEQAVADLPGFDRLSDDKKEQLIGMLERGECVTDSLKAVFGKVSPIALRSLFRDLGGGC